MQQERLDRFNATINKIKEAQKEVQVLLAEAENARDSFDYDVNPDEYDTMDGIVGNISDADTNLDNAVEFLEDLLDDDEDGDDDTEDDSSLYDNPDFDDCSGCDCSLCTGCDFDEDDDEIVDPYFDDFYAADIY